MNFDSRKAVCSGVVLLGLAAVSASALAGDNWATYDRKTYTGAQCQPAWGIHSKDFTIYQGKLRNENDAARWSSCAITFDSELTIDQADTNNTTRAGRMRVLVMLDYSGVPDILGTTYETSCTLSGRDLDGTLSKTQTLAVSAGRTTAVQTLDFQGSVWTGLSIGANHSLQVSCLQPSKVALIGYKIYEYGGTGHYYYTP